MSIASTLPTRLRRNRTESRSTRPDAGFTLLEGLITITLMGVLAVSLSAVITTVLRTAPGAEGRDDDARSLLGLITYMPEDVNSTPAGNFDGDQNKASGCSDPGGGVNLIHMTWEENIGGSITTYLASYRYIDNGDGYKIYRFSCEQGDPTTLVRGMSAELPPIDESTWVTGDSPIIIAETLNSDGDINGLTLEIQTLSGGSLDFEMRTNNLNEVLPPVVFTPSGPISPTNAGPTAANVTTSTTKGDPVTFSLPASDPDGDGMIVTLGAIPPGWTRSLSGLTLTLDPKNSHPIGFIATIPYSVADPGGLTASATISLEIVAALATNNPPTAGAVVTTGVAGAATLINLPVNDPDADPLTVTWSGAHPSLSISATGTTMSITSDGSTSSPGPFNYTVTDPSGATATNTIQIGITTCNVTGLTPANPSVQLKTNGRLKNSVTFTVTYSGPCSDLILEYDNNLDDGSYDPTFLSFGAGTTVTVQGHPGGLNWSLGTHVMTLRDGIGNPAALFTSSLEVT